MGSNYAYEHGLPCKNPSCKSHGRPHPNCMCYGLAEGGEVESFCSKDQPHKPDCEYFADGGQVEGFIPDDQFKPDPPAGDAQPAGFIPDSEFKPDVGNDANADLPPDELQARMVSAAHPEGPSTYESLPQQALTLGEGAAQGVAGPLATAAEKGLSKLGVPGLSDEDIVGRQEANPWEHHLAEAAGLGASALAGTGEAALAAKLGEGMAEIANFGKAGSAVVKGAIENGLIQGGDEVSKWMLGQGNPEDGVGASLLHMGAAGALGGLFGGAASKVSDSATRRASELADKKIGGKIRSLAAGFGSAANTPEAEREALDKTIAARYANGAGPDGGSFDLYKKGQKAFDELMGGGIGKIAHTAGREIGGEIGARIPVPFVGRWVGKSVGNAVSNKISPVLEKYMGPAAKKYAGSMTFRLLRSENVSGILDALNHAESMAKGYNMLEHGVDSVFKAGTNFGVNAYGDTKARKKLDDYVNGGGVDQDIKEDLQSPESSPEGYAEGGEVKSQEEPDRKGAPLHNDGVANHFPEHNVLLSAAKGRVSGYLNSLRPMDNAQKLPFDASPDQAKQQRSYHKALDLANQPLGILQEIHKGTILPEHVAHLKAMYPEVDQLLQKKLTEKVMQSQLDGKKPPYHVRQGLSLFMGAPLAAEMMPQNIQAAQAVFAKKAQQQGPQGQGSEPKKSAASLTKSDKSFLTGNQTLTARQQSKA